MNSDDERLRDAPPQSELDWFAAHPTRSHRIREIGPREVQICGLEMTEGVADGRAVRAFIVVRQVRPGVLRWLPILCTVPRIKYTNEAEEELELHALWDLLLKGEETFTNAALHAEIQTRVALQGVA